MSLTRPGARRRHGDDDAEEPSEAAGAGGDPALAAEDGGAVGPVEHGQDDAGHDGSRGDLGENDREGGLAADKHAGRQRVDKGRDVGAEDVRDDVVRDGRSRAGASGTRTVKETATLSVVSVMMTPIRNMSGRRFEHVEAAANALGFAFKLRQGPFEDGEGKQKQARPDDEYEQTRKGRVEGVRDRSEGSVGALQEGVGRGWPDAVEPALVEGQESERHRRALGGEGDEHSDDADGDSVAASAPETEGEEARGQHDEGGAESRAGDHSEGPRSREGRLRRGG